MHACALCTMGMAAGPVCMAMKDGGGLARIVYKFIVNLNNFAASSKILPQVQDTKSLPVSLVHSLLLESSGMLDVVSFVTSVLKV